MIDDQAAFFGGAMIDWRRISKKKSDLFELVHAPSDSQKNLRMGRELFFAMKRSSYTVSEKFHLPRSWVSRKVEAVKGREEYSLRSGNILDDFFARGLVSDGEKKKKGVFRYQKGYEKAVFW